MKRILFLITCIVLFSNAKPDFADYVEVSMNDVVLLKTHDFEKGQVTLKDLKGPEVLKIVYYTDTPELPGQGRFEIVVKKNKEAIKTLNGYDDMGATPTRIQAADIKNYDELMVYLRRINGTGEYRLFEIKIEK